MERKIFDDVQTKGLEDLQCEAFISTEHRDRSGDILESDGMRIKGRVVVLLAHGQGGMGMEPIAKPLWIKAGQTADGKKGIRARIQFFDDDTGRRLWRKIVEGILINWSVGWIPLDWSFRAESDGSETRIVHEWELLEFSPVGVPMNPYAQTISDSIKSQRERVWFKFLRPGDSIESGYKAVSMGGIKTISISDEFIHKTIKQTVHEEIERMKGKVR